MPDARCRICTANDREALIEDLAAEMWWNETDGRTWAEAGPHWQTAMRQFAERALRVLERPHNHA